MSALELLRVVVLVYAMGVPAFGLFAFWASPYEKWKIIPTVTINTRKLYLFCIALASLLWPASIVMIWVFKIAGKIDWWSDDDPDDPGEQPT